MDVNCKKIQLPQMRECTIWTQMTLSAVLTEERLHQSQFVQLLVERVLGAFSPRPILLLAETSPLFIRALFVAELRLDALHIQGELVPAALCFFGRSRCDGVVRRHGCVRQ